VDGGTGHCESEALCPVRGRWDPVNTAIRSALETITVAALAGHTSAPAVLADTTPLSLAAE
jgi:DNA-binding IscR family transcriptional regulator